MGESPFSLFLRYSIVANKGRRCQGLDNIPTWKRKSLRCNGLRTKTSKICSRTTLRASMAPKLPARDQASPHGEPPVLLLRSVRPSRPPYRRNDLPQVQHVAQDLVPCHLPHGLYALRDLRKADRARDWRYLQNGLAHVQADPHTARRTTDTQRFG